MIIDESQIKRVVELLTAKLNGVLSIYLFGSGVTNEFNRLSDVDLAVLCKDKIPTDLIWEIRSELENIVLRDVDLVDLRSTSLLHQMQVIYKGEKLYNKEAKATDLFEQHATELYLTLNEDRKIIMDGIKQDLSVYG